VDSPKLKTLKRIIEGISLIRHSFWLFEHIANKDLTKPLRKELKWLLHTFDWVETAIQLNQFTSKKHAFHKKISAAPELETVIESLKAKHPNQEQIITIFQSARYNQLILDLTLFLVEKRWQENWQPKPGSEQANQPVKHIAATLFENDWTETQHLLPHDQLTATSYINKKQKLQRNILSGCCLGELYKGARRDKFRKPWLDIIKGMDELATYDYLKKLCEQQLCEHQLCEQQPEPDKFAKILKWLEQKSQGLLSAMEQSLVASQKLPPYWQ
jgi:triphosphatase